MGRVIRLFLVFAALVFAYTLRWINVYATHSFGKRSSAGAAKGIQSSGIAEDNILKKKYIEPYMNAYESGMDHFEIAEKIFNISNLGRFMREIIPRLPNISFVLITGKSDMLSPPPDGSDILNDPRLIRWFTQNLGISHPKMEAIPIGLKNLKKGNTTHPWYIFPFILKSPSSFIPNRLLKRYRVGVEDEAERPNLVYLNFNVSHHPSRREALAALEDISKINFPSDHKVANYNQYFKMVSRSKFMASPKGVGIDCFRTWEAIAMGSIPIVENSTLNPLHEQGPVLIVDRWDKAAITEELLLNHNVKIRSRLIVTADYWFDKINQAREPFLDK